MKRFALLSIALIPPAGCQKAESSDTTVDESVDSADLVQNESAMLVGTADPVDPGMTAEQAASAAQAHAGALFHPASCVTATASGDTVTYQLDQCTGPFRRAEITGTVTATFSVASDGVHISATGTGLHVNAATMDMDAQAVFTRDGDHRQLVVQTHGQGTGPRGRAITREGSYTITWDAQTHCRTINGSWSLAVGERTRSVTVTDLTRCDGGCPQQGGTIVRTFFNGVTLTITFDGSDTADWSTSRGRSGTVNLDCTPAS